MENDLGVTEIFGIIIQISQR